jgi:hypothetical protein
MSGSDAPHFPPAFCKHCHFLFPATAFVMQAVENASFSGCTMTCPRCHKQADVLDGSYTTVRDTLEIFLSSTVSREARLALMLIVEEVQANKITLKEAARAAEKIKRGSGKLFDVAHWSDQAKAQLFAGILVAGATLTLAAATVAAPYFAPTPAITVQLPGLPGGPPLGTPMRSSPDHDFKMPLKPPQGSGRRPGPKTSPNSKSGKKGPNRPR